MGNESLFNRTKQTPIHSLFSLIKNRKKFQLLRELSTPKKAEENNELQTVDPDNPRRLKSSRKTWERIPPDKLNKNFLSNFKTLVRV